MFRKLKKLKRVFHKYLSSLYDKPLAPPTEKERELVEELRATFCEFASWEMTNCSSLEKEWFDNVNRLRELVLNDDPREFLRWDVISKTMFITHASYVSPELKYLKSLSDWDSRWRKALEESQVGHPVPYWRYPKSSGNLITHGYHLAQFEEKTEMYADNMNSIFEFGGGYGSMCRLLYNLGFQGKYILFDFPAFSALQRFFLKSIPLTIYSADSFKTAKSGVVCISDLEELKEILSKHIKPANSMFIATWSISEAPVKLRDAVLSFVHSFKGFLIGYQHQFKEMNNIDFFRDWTATQKHIEWYDWEIEHIPNNRYLIGKRKTN